MVDIHDVGGYELSFRSDGNWYADDEVIGNPRIAKLFSAHLCPDGEGGWVIDVGVDRQPAMVEDTPLVVRSVDGDSESGFTIRTSDGIEEALDCSTLRVGEAEVLYCTVDRGERGLMDARFLRPAYYHLAQHMNVDETGAVLESCGTAYRLAVKGA